MTTVVNKRAAGYDIYIGRPSKWGNPFTHLPVADTLAEHQVETREKAIRKYEEWIATQPNLIAAARQELRGKVLGCWCKPLACHGDILALIADGGTLCPNCGKDARFVQHSADHVETHGLDCGPYERWTDEWITCSECGTRTDWSEVAKMNQEPA